MTIAARWAFVLLLSAVAAARAEDYEIKIERSMKVGEKVRLTGDAAIQQRTVIIIGNDRRPGKSDSGAYQIDAVMEVLEKNEHDRTVKAKITIDKLTEIGQGVDKALLPKGTAVIMSHDGKATQFTVDGKPVQPPVKLALGLYFQVSPNLRKTDDEIFGTKDRKKVGDAWPVNGEEAKADLVNDGIDVSKAKISGEVKLLAARQERGLPCLELSMQMALEGAHPKDLPLPPGGKLSRTRIKAVMTGVFPQDAALQPLTSSMTQEMEIVMSLPPQPEVGPVDVESIIKRTKVMTATMIK